MSRAVMVFNFMELQKIFEKFLNSATSFNNDLGRTHLNQQSPSLNSALSMVIKFKNISIRELFLKNPPFALNSWKMGLIT